MILRGAKIINMDTCATIMRTRRQSHTSGVSKPFETVAS
jgi:hypothetical protein